MAEWAGDISNRQRIHEHNVGPNSSFTTAGTLPGSCLQGWPLGQLAAGAAPFRLQLAYQLWKGVPRWAAVCALLGSQSLPSPGSTTPRLLGDSRGPLQPGASPARSGTEITMPRAEAALEWGGDRQLHRSAPSQQGGGVHVPADPRQPGAPLRGGQAPAARSRLQHGRQQPPRELRPSQLSGPPLREHSALGSLEDWLAVLLMLGNQ